MQDRRTSFMRGIAALAALAIVAGCSSGASATPATSAPTQASAAAATPGSSGGSGSSGSSLVFPKETFTTATKTVTTGDGTSHEITYRLWAAIPYVSKPVDTTFQSLNVLVPISIDGKEIDATGAPILLNIPVGGYMSASVTGGSSGGGMGGGRPGGASGGAPGGGASNADLALAAGYVVVSTGVRGRDNQASDGTYYGKAPAAIVDIKAAVRYIRFNKGVIPGNTDWIISTGVSAGGALSSLLGASGDSDLYDAALAEIGAADASDAIFAVSAYCPITDLEHADMAYEWAYGSLSPQGGSLDSAVSTALAAQYPSYLASLALTAPDGSALTADTYGAYLVTAFLAPAATTHLAALAESDRTAYLASNTWITWSNGAASFTWADFVAHLGTRKKTAPAFDALDLSTAENIEFGTTTTDARHFTEWSLRQASGDASAALEADVPTLVNLMNPMYFLRAANAGAAAHWFIRVGTSDTDTSLSVVGNLAALLAGAGKDVDAAMYWDAGHGANQDADAFIAWIAKVTGYTK